MRGVSVIYQQEEGKRRWAFCGLRVASGLADLSQDSQAETTKAGPRMVGRGRHLSYREAYIALPTP